MADARRTCSDASTNAPESSRHCTQLEVALEGHLVAHVRLVQFLQQERARPVDVAQTAAIVTVPEEDRERW